LLLRRIVLSALFFLAASCTDDDTNSPALVVSKSIGQVPTWVEPDEPADPQIKEPTTPDPVADPDDKDPVEPGPTPDPVTDPGDPDDPTGTPDDPADKCSGPQDCDDGDYCTKDICSSKTNACKHEVKLGCCTKDSQCPDSGQCSPGICQENLCAVDLLANCCTGDEACNDDNACTADICVSTQKGAKCVNESIPGCCETAFANDFTDASDLADWTQVDEKEAVSWQLWTGRSVSPPSALYMGDTVSGSYLNHPQSNEELHIKTLADIASPTFKLTKDASTASLDFQLWLDVEDCEGDSFSFDIFRVVIDTPKLHGIVVLDKCDIATYNEWVPISVDLSAFVGQQINVRFHFNSIDANFNDGEGIYIDDIEVKTCY